MSATAEALKVSVPDIGDFGEVPVIEILVAVGDTVAVEDPLITLESDKATMDVPSPSAGVVKAIHVKVGDNVSEGSAVLDLETTSGDQAPSRPTEDAPAPTPEVVEERASESPIASAAQVATEAGETPAVAGLRESFGAADCARARR